MRLQLFMLLVEVITYLSSCSMSSCSVVVMASGAVWRCCVWQSQPWKLQKAGWWRRGIEINIIWGMMRAVNKVAQQQSKSSDVKADVKW